MKNMRRWRLKKKIFFLNLKNIQRKGKFLRNFQKIEQLDIEFFYQ